MKNNKVYIRKECLEFVKKCSEGEGKSESDILHEIILREINKEKKEEKIRVLEEKVSLLIKNEESLIQKIDFLLVIFQKILPEIYESSARLKVISNGVDGAEMAGHNAQKEVRNMFDILSSTLIKH